MYMLIGLLLLMVWVAPAAADPYYNSSEPGCNGSDPNVLMCDDFEKKADGSTPGEWYGLHCDAANGAGGIGPKAKGWCGSIYAVPITPAGAVSCGSGVTPLGSCAATSGQKGGGIGGQNMADHSFPNNQEVQDIYVRYYRKNSSGYSYSGQKVLSFNRCCAGGGGIYWAGLGFNIGQQSASTGAPDIGITNNLIGSGIYRQNLGNDLDMVSGNWYYLEVHIKLNTPGASNGVYELWVNNCGAAGTSCGSSPIQRARHTTINWGKTSSNGGIGAIWFENWANNGDGRGSTGQEWYDNVKVSKVGPIGLVGGGSTPPPVTYNLAATASGAGTVTGAGSYPVNTEVTPMATANAGATFTGWSGDCTGMTCTVTMTANKAVTATFTGGTTPPPVTGCAITPTPAAITFTHPPGGPLPAPQSVRVVTSDSSPYQTFDTGFYDAAPCYKTNCPSGTLTTITPMPTTLSLAAGTYTYPLDLTAGPNCPKVSVPVVLTIGAAPVPPSSMGKLTVEAQVTRCNYFLTAEPPDATGGWVAQFYRDGTTTVGAAISTPPYKRSVELYAPSHSFTVVFTKTGTTMRSPAAVTRACP